MLSANMGHILTRSLPHLVLKIKITSCQISHLSLKNRCAGEDKFLWCIVVRDKIMKAVAALIISCSGECDREMTRECFVIVYSN